MTRDEELNIIKQIKGGDRNLYSVIVNEYSTRLHLFVYGITKDNDIAQDILQETFVKAFFKIGKFRGDSSFFTWLNRIAYNETISYLRKKRKSVKMPEFEYPDKAVAYFAHISGEDLIYTGDEYEDILEKEAMEEKLHTAMDLLSPDEHLLLEMFYYKKIPIKEICNITGIGESNAKVKLFRAKNHLAALIKKTR